MTRETPPFRADHVGSLLRPQKLKEARDQREKGTMDAKMLRAIEDEEIARVIARQEALGLKAVTDGEFRRAMWHFDFLERLDGVESFAAEHGIKFAGGLETKAKGLKVTGKLGFSGHPFLDHFGFVRDQTQRMAKQTIPSPSVLHFRGGRRAVSEQVYPDMGEFYADLAAAYADAVKAFGAAGCRYLQLDETNLAYLCDEEQRENLRRRGDDPGALPGIYACMINAAIAAKPPGMTVTMHLCRGNFRSSWIATGGYEPVADILFNTINADGYFMEFDTGRSGGFEPLRLVPKHKMIVLGLVTSKSGRLEAKDDIKRRIEAAAKHIDPGQLALSPQCGFASTEEGNLLTEEEQWRKLEFIIEVASEIWGGV